MLQISFVEDFIFKLVSTGTPENIFQREDSINKRAIMAFEPTIHFQKGKYQT